jgi:hypothetical protein
VATGVAVGSVGIRATATSGTSTGSGVATLNVSTTSVTPATVSIQSIEQNGAPQNIQNLENQVDVRVNLERGGESVQKVQLLVDGIVVQEQAFGASAQASAPETAIEEIVFPWNTADFDATTGVPKFLNGNHTLSAKVITAQNETGTGSPTLQVRLDNSNRGVWNVEIAEDGQPHQALDADGLLWETGDLKVSVLPVIYSVANPTIAQVIIDPDGLVTKVDAAAPFEQTWEKGTAIGDEGSGGEGLPGIEDGNFVVCGSATANGQPVNLGCSDEDPVTGEDLDNRRFDNNGPGAPEFAANPNIRQNGWINAGGRLERAEPRHGDQQQLARRGHARRRRRWLRHHPSGRRHRAGDGWTLRLRLPVRRLRRCRLRRSTTTATAPSPAALTCSATSRSCPLLVRRALPRRRFIRRRHHHRHQPPPVRRRYRGSDHRLLGWSGVQRPPQRRHRW